MRPGPRIFLDASTLLAAAGSPNGGSSAVITGLIESREYLPTVSSGVLREAIGNVRLNLSSIRKIITYFALASRPARSFA